MRNISLLFVAFFIVYSGYAQIDSIGTSRNFYYLYEGKAVIGDSLFYSQPIVGVATINIDGVYDPVDSIMFFKDEVGLFVNTKYSSSRYLTEFAVRTIEGKYNYYVQVPIAKYKEAKETRNPIDVYITNRKTYIGLEYNDPLPASASNLYNALHKNPMVEKDVTKLRNHNRWGTALIFMGILSATGGIVYNATRETPQYASTFEKQLPAIIGGGFGLSCVTFGVITIGNSPDREEIVRKANSLGH